MTFLALYFFTHVYFAYKLSELMREELNEFFNNLDRNLGYGGPKLIKFFSFPYYYYVKFAVIRTWSQDLRDTEHNKKNYKFHKRGSISLKKFETLGQIKAELVLKNPLKLRLGFKVILDNADNEVMFIISPLFCTLYLTFYSMRFKMKGYVNYEYGFDLESFNLRWYWKSDKDSWAPNIPKWRNGSFNFRDFILGKVQVINTELGWHSDQNIWVKYRGQKVKIDRITVTKYTKFRTNVPYSLHHKTSYSSNIEVAKPPKFAGKGENSWDQGDDGIHAKGSTLPMEVLESHNKAGMRTSKIVRDYIIRGYFDSVSGSIKKYGRADGDRYAGTLMESDLEILGHKLPENELSDKLMSGHSSDFEHYLE